MMVRLNLKPYTVTRTTPAAPVNGRKVAGTTSTLPITANIQPANGEELETLPEHRRKNDVRVIYTETELFVEDATHEPDRIAIGSTVFEVFKCEPWARHFRAYASKVPA